MEKIIEEIIKQVPTIGFLMWMVWFLTPYVDKWFNSWGRGINSRLDDSRRYDENLTVKYHELDKKVDLLIHAVETIQIVLDIIPDRRQVDRREEIIEKKVTRDYEERK